ncbi:hypothetical protein HELRODRAFT_105476 [Helobdella robusta]|uniref:Disintegrin domain-containing protein n=1 Tax=Helobdella robusta TaxID=6412 RepID=T1EDV3_HELRO|nr:hypothetical protein HELRODRAFT_105476 [Helobdella robusta]ESO12677.1 hypothetical protein HELRODRAFT_105476 [Helobdella robusta]
MNSGLKKKIVPSYGFSTCSRKHFRKVIQRGLAPCLEQRYLVEPSQLPTLPSHEEPVCGNGIVEEEEDYDCLGKHLQFCNTSCYDAHCKLYDGNSCASGLCCDLNTCQIKTKGTTCRYKKSDCDVTESCDGISPKCPPDQHVHDGTKCLRNNYCISGKCGDKTKTCALLWGAGVKESSEWCYKVNEKANSAGHCGVYMDRTGLHYRKCLSGSYLCGRLWCQALATYRRFSNKMESSVHFQSSSQLNNQLKNATFCVAVDYHYGKTQTSPGLVPDGAACGHNMLCFKQVCRPRSYILSEMHVSEKVQRWNIARNSSHTKALMLGWLIVFFIKFIHKQI